MSEDARHDGDRPSGHIVTFYSYKGGTGRTMAVANTAWILASNGLRVLVVDWDLESPGLHRYFHPFLTDKQLRRSPGVIEMIRDFAAATVEPGHGGDAGWLQERADVLTYAMSLEWKFPDLGGIDLLPAGQQDRSYARMVNTFDWASFYQRLGGGAFIDALADNMRANYDYVLIDSRTGLSDGAGICTVQMPDTIVNCFTLSTQSVDGAVAVAQSVRSQRDRHPVRMLPVPMRVEDAEQLKLEAGRDYARHAFAPFLDHLSAEEVGRYWGDVEIPYKPFFAYEEILAPFAERPMLENSLLAAFERLASVLTDGRVTETPAMDERDRRTWLAKFERPRSPVASDVVVSYAAADRMWAEWVRSVLSEAGLGVALHDVDFAGGPASRPEMERLLASARHAVVLLSSNWVASPHAPALWQSIAQGPDGGPAFLIPVRLDSTRVKSPFTDRVPVDLTGVAADRAREMLLAAVDRPVPAAPSGARSGPRYPATLPPVWNVPQRNSDFTGRAAVLEQLRERLSASVTAVVPQALYGLGGVGKTQVALEYAYRFNAAYDLVWWISAEQPHLVRSSLAELGERIGLQSGDSLDDAVRITLDALRQGRPYQRWLLIFDNVDEPDAVRDMIPQGAGHVLLTSRNQAWNQEARAVQIGVFTREESIAFLTRRVRGLQPDDATEVAEKLGDLPLAIEQAAAWLTATGMPVAQYLELLDTQLLRMLEENPPLGYEKTTAATWLLSLDRLRADTPAAARLLEVCAFFAPEPIPTWLVYSSRFTEVLLPYDPTLRDPILQGRLVREIGRYALASIDSAQSAIQIHRLVQAVIRNSLDESHRDQTQRDVQEILASASRKDPEDPENWPVYAQLWPHLRHAGALASPDPAVRQLIMDMARYLYRRGDFRGSRELVEEALAIWRDAFGEDATTLFLGFHLGNALRSQADYQRAHDTNQYALTRLTEVVGPSHPYTVMTAGSVGADLRALGRYHDARALDEQTLNRATDVFGENHDRTLKAANNLAVSLRLVGDFGRAAELDEDTLRRRRTIFGPNHVESLLAANNYGHDLRAIGRFQESRRLLEDTLARYREILGDGQADTLRAAKNLAVTLRKTGEFQAAHALTTETLRRYIDVLGPDHPDTLSCLMNRACEESAMGDHAAAAATAGVVVAGFRNVYVEDHPFVLAGMNNLAIFTRLLGLHGESHSMSQLVHGRFAATLGERHPYTLSGRINLGNDLFDLGEYAAALRVDEEAWQGLRQVLGADNPDTLAAGGNLAVSRRKSGDVAAAVRLQGEVLDRSRRVLGETHPNTVAVRDGIRLNCDISPPPT